jgi:hypothetical protein
MVIPLIEIPKHTLVQALRSEEVRYDHAMASSLSPNRTQPSSRRAPFLILGKIAMAAKKTFADNSAMREIAMAILKTCGGERQIVLEVQRVMNTVTDSLSMDAAFKRLDELRMRCLTSSKA